MSQSEDISLLDRGNIVAGIGAVILAIQNGLFLPFIFFIDTNPIFGELAFLLLVIDLFGFALIGIGLIIMGFRTDQKLLVSGMLFFLWIIPAFVWRASIGIYGEKMIGDANTLSEDIEIVFYLMFLSAILLLIGLILVAKSFKVSGLHWFLFLLYGVSNLISVVLVLLIIGIFLKLLFIPIPGVIVFIILSMRFMEGLPKDEYPTQEFNQFPGAPGSFSPSSSTYLCPHCRAEIKSNAQFCQYCGKSIKR